MKVEECAKAIAERYGDEWERLTEADQNDCRNAARAVLTCLLGSVEEMDALALRCQHESGHPGDTFREIINAILQQNPSPVESGARDVRSVDNGQG